MKNQYELAAYYFPNYHIDPVNEKRHGQGWSEWRLVKSATSRFEGHRQPRIPAWGYEDEADPGVMEKKIDAAASHGISAFIFDWYWYDGGSFLQKCLDEGYLKANNNHRVKFSLMWANHNWLELFPARKNAAPKLYSSGSVHEEEFIRLTNHIIESYFSHPSYWRVNGGLYFSIYELMGLVKDLGGIGNTARVLKDFRTRVKAAGYGELHLNAVVWGIQVLPGETGASNPEEMVEALGFDSVTSYVWMHHVEMKNFPKTSYAWCREEVFKEFEKFMKNYTVPYFPNVTMGWDSSPRTVQSEVFEKTTYPYVATLDGNTPEEFEKSLLQAKTLLDRVPDNQRILTINAWNEWTEGSYLEPDTVYGMKYLEAIRKVFMGG